MAGPSHNPSSRSTLPPASLEGRPQPSSKCTPSAACRLVQSCSTWHLGSVLATLRRTWGLWPGLAARTCSPGRRSRARPPAAVAAFAAICMVLKSDRDRLPEQYHDLRVALDLVSDCWVLSLWGPWSGCSWSSGSSPPPRSCLASGPVFETALQLGSDSLSLVAAWTPACPPPPTF